MVTQLSYDEASSVLTDCLNCLAGNAAPERIDGRGNAMRQWGLDSEDGVDLAADISARLGITIPHDENPLVEENSTGQKRARTFKEVVQYIMSFLG
jgi:acyl carrier protein